MGVVKAVILLIRALAVFRLGSAVENPALRQQTPALGRVVAVAVGLGSLAATWAPAVLAADGAPTAVLRIPKLAHPPAIDGKLDPRQWRDAAAITGFPNLNGEMSLPQSLQPIWYLAYDDQNLYLAFHYPVFPRGSLRSAVKTKRDKPAASDAIIMGDDHTEIEICNTGREKAVAGYFYKFLTNPWDVVIDQKVRWSVGQMGYEYDTGAIAKSYFANDYWEQEIAIPLKDLGTARINDGDRWVMQIVSADIGILGLSPKLASEAKYLSAAFGRPGGEVIGRNSMPFAADGTAKLEFAFPALPEACYDIAMEIQDGDGKTLLSKKDTFERKVFPFESFKLGLEETVVKPYTPIKAQGRAFETIGNHVELTDTGLVAGIQDRLVPQEAGREILASPISLVATQNGRQMKLGPADKSFEWSGAGSPTKAVGTAESRLAGLTLRLNGQADYTGQYLVNMDIVPGGRIALDRLELQVPVSDPADTCFAYAARDGIVLYRKDHPWIGNPPEGELWNNLSQRSVSPYIMYVGNGERGLYWYTDSYEGFWIDRNRPHVFLDKQRNATVLRIALVNKPVVLDRPRHVRFALMAVPTKPRPADARRMQWSDRMHIGGASWWGTIGAHVFPTSDEQWQNWIAGKPFFCHGKPYPGQCALLPNPPRGRDGRWLLEKGHEYGAYRAADMVGYLQPENRGFAGEWTGVTHPETRPDASLLGYKDDQGRSVWPEPEQRAILGKDPCVRSSYDYDAYYFYLMAKNTGAGGCWWDWNIPINFSNRRARTVLALALLHDNGVCGADGDKAGMETLRKAGILDESAHWIPYWRSAETAAAVEPGLLISAYRFDDSKRLTLAIVNPGPADIRSEILVPGFTATTATDDETGAPLANDGPRLRALTVKRHDFRLITLEAARP